MKKLKKIAVLLIIFILSTTATVFADNASAEITLAPSASSATSAKAGESITLLLTAKCATGIEGIDSTLTWDSTKLELTNQDSLTANGYINMSGIDESTGKFKLSVLYGGSGKTPTEANFVTLNFKILETANANEKLAVTLSEIELGDSDDNWIAIEDKTIELTVLGDTPPLEDENTPSEDENTPSEDENTPSEDENTPSEDENTPSEDENIPSEDENTPSEDENTPSEDESVPPVEEDTEKPSQEQNKEEDKTIANKPINNAGLVNYAIILVIAMILTIALYLKCKKYKDVK